ncbi:hypothetical protein [Bordetella sp. LUAb4]|uniref:hypothetical protein n=1 Tax=Bordetella sp. LUAb4 TaxID=2843195 RepID=UPI001E3A4ACC|nr:hypothetical protein [Bordetella sp. LUAb4]
MALRLTYRMIAAALFMCASAHGAAAAATATAPAAAAAAASAAARAGATYTGRGIFNFASSSGCPLGDATAGGQACNRLALTDADTRATVATDAHTIRFDNTRHYAADTPVGDVLLQGSGVDAQGKRVPLSLHLKLSRDGGKWAASMHAHAPVRGDFTDLRIDPYRVMVNGPSGEETVLTPEQAIAVMAKPSLSARIAQGLVQVRAAGQPDAPDVIVALGVGKVAKRLARVRFHSQSGGAVSIPAQLAQGNWSLDMQALSGQIPRRAVQGDLFLFGLENETLLRPLREKGFAKHDALTVGAKDGQGYLRYNGVQQPFPQAERVARLFMEDSFLGLILTQQRGTQAPTPTPPASAAREK